VVAGGGVDGVIGYGTGMGGEVGVIGTGFVVGFGVGLTGEEGGI
jgi:hypothetical protein